MYTENCEEIRYAAKIRCKKKPWNVARDISHISKLSFNKPLFLLYPAISSNSFPQISAQ